MSDFFDPAKRRHKLANNWGAICASLTNQGYRIVSLQDYRGSAENATEVVHVAFNSQTGEVDSVDVRLAKSILFPNRSLAVAYTIEDVDGIAERARMSRAGLREQFLRELASIGECCGNGE